MENMWQDCPPELVLSQNTIQIWLASLDWSLPGTRNLQAILSEEERDRSQAFYFEKDRRHFIVARGLLRLILGQCLGIRPGTLEFDYGEYGKPVLKQGRGEDTLQFNISHSNGRALIAVAQNRLVGVDIEYMRPDPKRLEIADRFFSPREVAALRSLPNHLQEAAFYTCWTRKEAYIKATGKGLALGLEQFDVSLLPTEKPALLRNDHDPGEVSRWVFYTLPSLPGYAAVLIAEGPPVEVKCWQWFEELQETS